MWGLYSFDAGVLVTALVLFALPALTLAHFTLAPPAVLLSVALLGSGIAVLLEGTAHIYGLWYSIGADTGRLFGLISTESLITITLQVLFLGLLYEVLFDDGRYTPRSAWQRMVFFATFGVAVIVLIGMHHFLVTGTFVSYAYFWIIGVVTASALAALALHRNLSVGFFDKILDFTLLASIPLGLSLWISLVNVHKVFANTNEYVHTISLYGQTVPIEEIALIFALPFFVGTMYEMYLDDRS